eukprot:15361626-Ditylum_brightwellii.AAC.1
MDDDTNEEQEKDVIPPQHQSDSSSPKMNKNAIVTQDATNDKNSINANNQNDNGNAHTKDESVHSLISNNTSKSNEEYNSNVVISLSVESNHEEEQSMEDDD